MATRLCGCAAGRENPLNYPAAALWFGVSAADAVHPCGFAQSYAPVACRADKLHGAGYERICHLRPPEVQVLQLLPVMDTLRKGIRDVRANPQHILLVIYLGLFSGAACAWCLVAARRGAA